MKTPKPQILIVCGPTASGKTGFAARLASELKSEVISADSRQVYRKMDIGTGKDYNDYKIKGKIIPSHMIDIVDPGYKYNVFEYQRDFLDVYNKLKPRIELPVICGGSGMYIDSIVSGYKLINVPINTKLRKELEDLPLTELQDRLVKYKKLHNSSDTDNKKRAVRAIEIEEYYIQNPDIDDSFPAFESLIIGLKYDRDSRRRRITERLKSRLDEGMVDEVRSLIDSGVPVETLEYYGLEYKFITRYIKGELSLEEMSSKLETAIHQFAKRQMTWFRGMERRGIKIYWLDAYMPMDQRIERVFSLLGK